MKHTDPQPARVDVLLDAIDDVEQLPHSQAFEQVMYDNAHTRYARFESESTVTIGPKLFKSQFPEAVKDYFVSSNSLEIDDLVVSYLSQRFEDDHPCLRFDYRGKMTFKVNDTEYTVTEYDNCTVISIVSESGRVSEVAVGKNEFIAMLASIVYATQYDMANPDKNIYLMQDPLIQRADSDEALVECMIMTLGSTTGASSVRTTSVFESNGKVLQAELLIRETTRISGINNTLGLSEITLRPTIEPTLHQNVVSTPALGRLTSQYFELCTRNGLDAEARQDEDTLIVTPDNIETYGNNCLEFNSIIGPMIAEYSDTADNS